MKSGAICLLSLVCTFLSITSFGQQTPAGQPMFITDSTMPKPIFGVKAGVNLMTITGSDWVQATNTGFAGGVFAGFQKNKFGVQLEVLLCTTHYLSKIGIDSDGNVGNFNASYLSIPLLLEYKIVPWLAIQAGPQYSNIISVTKNSTFYSDPKVVFTSSEFAGVVGLEGKLPHNISIGARYIYGFSNINNNTQISTVNNTISSQEWHNRSVHIYAAYSIK